jgi:hypothetical protein
MYADGYIAAAILYFIAIVFVTARIVVWEEVKGHTNRSGISVLVVLLGAAAFCGSLLWIIWVHKDITARNTPPRSPIDTPASDRPKSPFSIGVGPAINTDRKSTVTGFVFMFQRGGKYTVVPINLALYMRIANLQSTSSTIEQYGVEAKTDDGVWVPMIRLESRAYDLFYAPDGRLDKAGQIKVILLDEELTAHSLRSGDKARGWAFFEYPEDTTLYRLTHEYRVTVTDHKGTTFITGELSPQEDTTNKGIQDAVIGKTDIHIDLSKAEIKFVEKPTPPSQK